MRDEKMVCGEHSVPPYHRVNFVAAYFVAGQFRRDRFRRGKTVAVILSKHIHWELGAKIVAEI